MKQNFIGALVLALLLGMCFPALTIAENIPDGWGKETGLTHCPVCYYNVNFFYRTVPATCTEAGYKERMCSYRYGIAGACTRRDFDIYYKPPATGHAWNEGIITDPSYENEGFTTFTCANCGEERVEDRTNPLQAIPGGNGSGGNGNLTASSNSGSNKGDSSMSGTSTANQHEKAAIGNCREWVNIREGEGTNTPVIGKALLGEEIQLLQWNKGETWCKVLYNGGNNLGWVYGKFILTK